MRNVKIDFNFIKLVSNYIFQVSLKNSSEECLKNLNGRLKPSFILDCETNFSSASYSLYIIPPDSVQKALDEWAESTPGATQPNMGWHITLKQPFIPRVRFQLIERIISDTCQNIKPFYISLDKIGEDIHLRRPSLSIVYLIASSPNSVLRKLHLSLLLKLSPVISNLYPNLSVKSEGKNHVPHISLTWGVKKEKVALLEAEARKLNFSFWVKEIHLLKAVNSEERYCWQKFVLGKG